MNFFFLPCDVDQVNYIEIASSLKEFLLEILQNSGLVLFAESAFLPSFLFDPWPNFIFFPLSFPFIYFVLFLTPWAGYLTSSDGLALVFKAMAFLEQHFNQALLRTFLKPLFPRYSEILAFYRLSHLWRFLGSLLIPGGSFCSHLCVSFWSQTVSYIDFSELKFFGGLGISNLCVCSHQL